MCVCVSVRLAAKFHVFERAPPQIAASVENVSNPKVTPPPLYLHLFIDVAAEIAGGTATATSGPRMVRGGRRRRLVIVVITAVVQQVSFERRVEHVDVQILKGRRPALVQHLQHVRQLVVLARVLPRMVARVVVVHLVRVMPGGHRRVVRMVRMTRMATVPGMDRMARVTAVVLLVLQGGGSCGRVVLHVLRRNVLLLHVRWGRAGGAVTAAAAVGVGLHRFGCGRRMVSLPTAPDSGTRLRRGWRVRRRLARSGRTELRVRGPRRRSVRAELTVLVTFGDGLRLS